MAKKIQSFADKMLSKTDVVYCNSCGEPAEAIVMVRPETHPDTGAYRYVKRSVKLCSKCNEEEVLG